MKLIRAGSIMVSLLMCATVGLHYMSATWDGGMKSLYTVSILKCGVW